MDRFDPSTRSEIMSKIKSKNTGPEMKIRRALHASGFRFRIHRKDLPGKPDIVLPRYRVSIFVNGCFWHGHDCNKANLPKSNSSFWANKIRRNKKRDMIAINSLQNSGWKVYVLWECEIEKGIESIIDILKKLQLQVNESI